MQGRWLLKSLLAHASMDSGVISDGWRRHLALPPEEQ